MLKGSAPGPGRKGRGRRWECRCHAACPSAGARAAASCSDGAGPLSLPLLQAHPLSLLIPSSAEACPAPTEEQPRMAILEHIYTRRKRVADAKDHISPMAAAGVHRRTCEDEAGAAGDDEQKAGDGRAVGGLGAAPPQLLQLVNHVLAAALEGAQVLLQACIHHAHHAAPGAHAYVPCACQIIGAAVNHG